MIQLRALLLGMVVSVTLAPAIDRAESVSAADRVDLRALYEQLLDGWNRGSGPAFAAVFDEHADLVGPGGFHITGRERIASFHQMLFDGALKDTHLVGAVRSIRFLTDDVAILYAVGGRLGPGDAARTLRRQSVHTMVAVKRNGKWLFDAFQSTLI